MTKKIWESIISFDGIYGSSPETPHKVDVIRYALQTHQLPAPSLIIGDTKFDMIGAQETGIKKVCCYLGIWRRS